MVRIIIGKVIALGKNVYYFVIITRRITRSNNSPQVLCKMYILQLTSGDFNCYCSRSHVIVLIITITFITFTMKHTTRSLVFSKGEIIIEEGDKMWNLHLHIWLVIIFILLTVLIINKNQQKIVLWKVYMLSHKMACNTNYWWSERPTNINNLTNIKWFKDLEKQVTSSRKKYKLFGQLKISSIHLNKIILLRYFLNIFL